MVASKLFSAEDRKAISAAVTDAERKTSAEIVPVVATISDRYERAEDLVGILLAYVAVAATWTLPQQLLAASDWEGSAEFRLQLPFVLGVIAVGWMVGLFLARMFPWLKRLALTQRTMTARVLIAAHHAFDSLHAHKTVGGTGVVVYVSLFERRVCVWADRKVSEKIPEAEWKSITEQLIHALRDGKPRDGFVEAIRKAGELLAKPFPVQPGDTNELSNELRILD
ncbi:MAG TPA: TPM domain-containing protein [Planctomycetota bacterium]|nr:TPM domain-containing protein [Planctomycetota bacterium]